MGRWLDKLRGKSTIIPHKHPTKPTEGAFVGFVGRSQGGYEKNFTPQECPDEVLHIFSRTLDMNVWVVPDGFQGTLEGPIYTDAEIRELDRQSVTQVESRQIHTAKVEFDGEIVA